MVAGVEGSEVTPTAGTMFDPYIILNFHVYAEMIGYPFDDDYFLIDDIA